MRYSLKIIIDYYIKFFIGLIYLKHFPAIALQIFFCSNTKKKSDREDQVLFTRYTTPESAKKPTQSQSCETRKTL